MSYKVMTFGDKIPPGNDDDLFVSYVVEGFGSMLCGPYNSMEYAESEKWDIGGYEGVKDVKIVTRHELMGKTASETFY